MNKTQIEAAFDGRISPTAIQLVGDEVRIVGNWCYVTHDGKDSNRQDVYDIWICNPANIRDGLGQRKVRNIIHALNLPLGTSFRELNGEAWAKVRGTGLILQNLALLGIRQKRQISPEQHRKLAVRLKAAREARL